VTGVESCTGQTLTNQFQSSISPSQHQHLQFVVCVLSVCLIPSIPLIHLRCSSHSASPSVVVFELQANTTSFVTPTTAHQPTTQQPPTKRPQSFIYLRVRAPPALPPTLLPTAQDSSFVSRTNRRIPRMMDPLSILALAAETVQRSEANKSLPACTTRKGQLRDVPLLGPVARSAAEIYRSVNLDNLLDLPTLNRFNLTSLIDAGHLWVAVNRWDEPVGFVGGENIGGNFHIVEISVAHQHQGRGIGKMLMARMMEDVKREGFRATTLMTYRNIPWNGPFYRKLGFMEVDLSEMGYDYLKIWQHEGSLGLDMGQRCLMGRIL